MTSKQKLVNMISDARKALTDILVEDVLNLNYLTEEQFNQISEAEDKLREIMFDLLDRAAQ